MTLILKLDLDMVKMYLHTKNEASMSRGSKVIAWTDRNTDTQTDTQTHRQTHRHDWKHYLPAYTGGNNRPAGVCITDYDTFGELLCINGQMHNFSKQHITGNKCARKFSKQLLLMLFTHVCRSILISIRVLWTLSRVLMVWWKTSNGSRTENPIKKLRSTNFKWKVPFLDGSTGHALLFWRAQLCSERVLRVRVQ